MKETKAHSKCPLSCTSDFLGDKWSLMILLDLMFTDKSTYGEFLNSDEKIATNILAVRLTMLYSYGFRTKLVAPDKNPGLFMV